MRLELKGFAPDADPATPGILTDCDAIVPTTQGLAAANSLVAADLPALAADATSAFSAELLDGSTRLFAATAAGIFEATSGTWTDRSRATGYTGTERQRFAVFGNVVLATNRTEVIGASSSGAAFADIATAPIAKDLCIASGFVMAVNVSGGTLGDAPDGWWCSAIRDHTSWTPSATTQATYGRLLDSPGAIRAGVALGADVVAYKDTSMYLGRYVGPPLVWAWQRVPGDIGCSGPESVVTVGTRHYFIGPSDFYTFDGTVPQSIPGAPREWFFANLNATYRDRIIGVVDQPRDLIYWYYPSQASSGELDSVLIYNTRTGMWGKQARAITAALQYSSGQTTYDALGTDYATYDDLPDIAYDSTFWLADSKTPAVFVGADLFTLNGEPGASWLQTGDFGDLTDFTMLRRATPRYRTTPTTGRGTNYHRATLGEARTQDATNEMMRSRFDFRRSARWHSIRLDHDDAAVLNGIDIDLVPSGRE